VTSPLEQCLRCDSEQAIDVRHLHSAMGFENNRNMSPNLVPLGCCRVKIVNITWDAGAAAAAAPAGYTAR
jgi:hypothetical protein